MNVPEFERAAPFVHIALFSLPKGASPSEAEILSREIDAKLRGLPSVAGIWWGPPAGTWSPERAVVDENYDVGLLVLFRDKAALDTYIAHPLHEEFATKWDSRCSVRVFDFTM